jgi:hypothetical protein
MCAALPELGTDRSLILAGRGSLQGLADRQPLQKPGRVPDGLRWGWRRAREMGCIPTLLRLRLVAVSVTMSHLPLTHLSSGQIALC